MRALLFTFSLVLVFSASWGFETKRKAQSVALSKSTNVTTNSVSEPATPAKESHLNASIRGESYETQFVRADVFQLKFNYFLKYYVSPNFYTKVNPIARLYSGQVQSIDAQEKMVNNISVQNAAVYGEWMKESYVGLGIIDQYGIFSSLLIDDRMAFVTAQAKQSLVKGPWTFSLQGQGSIPNSDSAINDQKEKESTPMLTSIGLLSNWNLNDKNQVEAKANYFKFSNIPTSISTTSVINGNTSADSRLSETERLFKYDYYGVDTSLSFKRRIFKTYYVLGNGSYLQNQGAPAGINQAYRAGGGIGFNIIDNNELELSGYQFRIESDAVLAAYANTDYFRCNRNGYELGAAWKNIKRNFRITFYYNDSRLIVENPALSDGKLYILRFEVMNVAI